MSPHDKMSILDVKGEAYWIEDLCIVQMETMTRTVEGRTYHPYRFDVMAHGPGWIQLREENSENPGVFFNMRNVVSLRIVEG